jgi:predicted transcriptional regulator
MDRASQIIQVIKENPGIRFSEIMRQTGLKNGVLSHHLAKIEQEGKAMVERTPRVARIYPCGIDNNEANLIRYLRNPTVKRILVSLLNEGLSFKEIHSATKKSQGTVSVYLKELTEAGIVNRRFIDMDLVFELDKPKVVREVIEKNKASLIERTADNISDIFSSI